LSYNNEATGGNIQHTFFLPDMTIQGGFRRGLWSRLFSRDIWFVPSVALFLQAFLNTGVLVFYNPFWL
jgi:hypothetical protein